MWVLVVVCLFNDDDAVDNNNETETLSFNNKYENQIIIIIRETNLKFNKQDWLIHGALKEWERINILLYITYRPFVRQYSKITQERVKETEISFNN